MLWKKPLVARRFGPVARGAVAAMLIAGLLVPAPVSVGASPDLQLRNIPEATELGDITDEAKTVVNSTIDDAAGDVERYRFELSSPKSVEVVLRRLDRQRGRVRGGRPRG